MSNTNNQTCENCKMNCCPLRHLDKRCVNFTEFNWLDRFKN